MSLSALLFRLALATVTALAPTVAAACDEDAMLVLDASGSMGIVRHGQTKLDIAREAAARVLPDLTRKRRTGLVTYGGDPGQRCGGIALRFPPMADSAGLIVAQLGHIEPAGQTPLSPAVMLAAETLNTAGKPGIVVLVTDGLENCGFSACAVGARIARELPNVRVHVIGFDLGSQNEAQIACLAQQTGGVYSATDTLEGLQQALKERLGCPRISLTGGWSRRPG
ncbi:MAG: VWA domain-containing protein [Hyphomicrobiaceae bacterium]